MPGASPTGILRAGAAPVDPASPSPTSASHPDSPAIDPSEPGPTLTTLSRRLPSDRLLGSDAGLPALLGHELRNPLAGAMTNVAVAAELTDPGDPRAPLLRMAQKELVRMHALLERCLEFARLGRIAPRRHDLVALAREVAERPRDGSVRVRAGREGVTAGVDKALLERALENLLENAFAAGAKTVELVVEAAAGHALLRISDDGPGVAADLRDRIFEPFVSGRGSHGLGLPFAKQVVDAHGGSIRLERTERGATFQISLPA